jgi:hypothetical protein
VSKPKPRPLSERGIPSNVKKIRLTLRTGYATASKWRSLQNNSSSKSFEHYAILIFKWIYSRHLLSWIYFSYTNHFNFTCYPIILLKPKVQSLSKQTNILESQIWHYFMNLRNKFYFFHKNMQFYYQTTSTCQEHGETKMDLCLWYSAVIENYFQCWFIVHIIWRRLWCLKIHSNRFCNFM